MPNRRHTIPVATSAVLFLCLMLHAQASLSSSAFIPYNNPEAYKIYQSLLPTDWTVTVAHARRLLIHAQTGTRNYAHSHIVLSPVASHGDKSIAEISIGHSCGVLYGGSSYVVEKTDGFWKNIRWRNTSRAWAS